MVSQLVVSILNDDNYEDIFYFIMRINKYFKTKGKFKKKKYIYIYIYTNKKLKHESFMNEINVTNIIKYFYFNYYYIIIIIYK